MKISLRETLAALNSDPLVNRASGIGEERTLILDMIDDLIAGAQDGRDALDGMGALDVAEHIATLIRQGHHRRDFGE